MTKKHVVNCLDSIFWFLVYIMPLFLWCAICIKAGAITSFESVFTTIGIDITTDNIIYTALTSIFGVDGVFPIFNGTAIFTFITYFASVYFVHFIVDVLMWVVRWAHDFMNKGGRDLW